MHNAVLMGNERSASWADFREDVGRRRDHWRALQLISAATGYNPLPHQLRAHVSPARHKLVLGGVGCGKTKWSMVEIVKLAICNSGENVMGAVLAPTFDGVIHVLRPELESIFNAMAKMGCPLVRRYHKSMAKYDMIDGSSLLLRSAHRVDGLRGFSIAYCAIDESEAFASPDYVFNVLSARLRAKCNITQIHCTSTPKGYRGLPKMWHQARQTEDRDDWFCARATSMDNTHLPNGYIDSLRSSYSKRAWEQEIGGRVLRPSHSVFPEFSPAIHTREWEYSPMLPYDVCIDWGYNKPYFALIQRLPDGSAILFDEFYEDEVPIARQKQWLINKIKSLKKDPEHIAADRAMRDLNQWAIYTFQRTFFHRMESKKEQNILNGIERVREMLDPLEGPPRFFIAKSLTKTDNPRAAIHALQNYAWSTDRNGEVTTERARKDGLTDHCADAVRYWCMSVGSDKQHPRVVQRKDAFFKQYQPRFK